MEVLARSGLHLVRRHRELVAAPSLQELETTARATYESASDLVIHELDTTKDEIDKFASEFSELQQTLGRRMASSIYPASHKLGEESAFALYTLTRILKPAVIFESGVADGYSSVLFLSAIATNGHGKLISTDISGDVGNLLTPEERQSWDLKILRRDYLREDFIDALQAAGKVQLFVHDSDHRYRWQLWELETVHDLLSSETVIACDDVDSSYGFLHFCDGHTFQPALLREERKVLGIVIPDNLASHPAE